ncbi:DMT family transporter [uncultured Fusobacterium sp.]|jgi:drug/metabolite transporter (DMT)-like permease|uniref:DMT family transporter n=1 Tax=uncultured Fusobacterium sp. TaxID=159267 RepID=UPI0025E0B311|nr:DMT family transporter [uncultured Fusobacterium sp.]MCF2639127.1 DMT family transporter [Fusobacterium varium]
MERNRKIEVIASIVLAVVALVWGTTYAVIKDTLSIIQPFSLMMFRFGFSALILSLMYLKKFKTIKGVDLKRGIIIGIFMFLAFYFLIVSIRFTTASKFSFIVGAYVLIVPFLSWIINKTKLDRYAIVGAILATIGLAFLTMEKGAVFNLWDLVAGCCSFFFAAHMIAIEKYSGDSDPILLTIIQFITTAVLFIILTGVKEGYNFTVLPEIKWTLGYLVIISTIIPFAIQNIVQRYISSTSTALILTLQSAFGSIFAVYYLDERMTKQMIIGCLLIFIAIVFQETKLKFLKR